MIRRCLANLARPDPGGDPVSTIRTAADTIRALVGALPEHIRGPWDYQATSIYMDGHTSGSISVPGYPAALQARCAPGVGDYIATVASPDVAAAFADLLETIARHNRRDSPHGWDDCNGECIDAIVADAGALADAITRRGRQ